jgi:hypothetical protein
MALVWRVIWLWYSHSVRLVVFRSRISCNADLGGAVRLAGGALMISVEKDLTEDNAGMITATYVLVNLGIVPLLAAYDGFLSLM